MNSRQIALEILLDIEKNKGYSNISIKNFLKKYREEENANFIRELVYGVLENKDYLDYIIRKKSSVRLKKIHPTVLMILRMGVYQLCFLDRVPESAAVNESVKLTQANKLVKSKGFVNGILRSVAREKDKLMEVQGVKDNEYLSIRYSHPQWLVDKWIGEYGYDFTKELCRINNTRPELNIRVNSRKIGREELRLRLEDLGFKVRNTVYSSYGLVIENPSRIVESEEFKDGLFTIQDESSMLVAEIMDPDKPSLVLDLCSAPGGKATHIGELMDDSGRIIARDIYSHKLDLIKKNYKRLGLTNIESQLHDGLKLDKDMIGQVDYCLLDAPCSALGTIRRSPEVKWTRSPEDIKDILGLQIQLLDIASKYVKLGGVLIYSTCTINTDENIDMIETFLEKNQDFRLMAIDKANLKEFETSRKGYLEIYPNLHNMDGFFIAKLERINNNSINMI